MFFKKKPKENDFLSSMQKTKEKSTVIKNSLKLQQKKIFAKINIHS